MASDKMTRSDYVYTNIFLERYARAVVKAIKDRTPKDTGELQASINYKITYYRDTFNIYFAIGNGRFQKGSGLPSEYGTYLDAGGEKITYHYKGSRKRTKGWFSDPIPGLGERYFTTNLLVNMQRDQQLFLTKLVKSLQVEADRNKNKYKNKTNK